MARAGAKYHDSLFWRLFDGAAGAVDRRIGWHRLPRVFGILALIGVRDTLRRKNLHDTDTLPAEGVPAVPPLTPELERGRGADGSHNDRDQAAMGRSGARFGRNVPHAATAPEPPPGLLEPNPRTVSRVLMTRHELDAATGANALVASWLQFMIRDWFSHGEGRFDRTFEVPVDDDDSWAERPMRVPKTNLDPTRPAGSTQPPTYVNVHTHWWDASSVYGDNSVDQELIRTGSGGKVRLTPEGLLPFPDGPDSPVRRPGFWLGLVMLQTLFAREHNAICDKLAEAHPGMAGDDDDLFRAARLVNAALIAKIHTVEWTPTVIAHPTTRWAMRINWWGLAGERVHRRRGRISKSEVISGIPGSPTNHYGVPFALTEEFVAVYRMHPLVPDDYSLRSLADDSPIGREETLRSLSGPGALEVQGRVPMADLFYSFGTLHPGLVTLHNFPRFLQEFERPDGKTMDLAAVDILRAREQGVPRYNEFRRLLHLKPARSFADLTDNPAWAQELEQVYGDVERVDLMAGMYAERRPKGFAFSDTAFRIFVLMASRRLNSDRFFTADYREEIYTEAGLRWIADNTMATVLRRHFPELAPAMAGATTAFAAWSRAGSGGSSAG